jgi:predicted CXXCH cytochrome family protein
MTRRLEGLVVAIVLGAAACGGAARDPGSPGAPSRREAVASREVASNVTFDDYAGTRACAPCHASHVETWLRSPMHNMTREADVADVKNPFDGTFRLKDDEARLAKSGKERFVTITSRRFGSGTWKVTRVIGGHHREDYAGVLVEAPREGARVLSSEELVLPVTFVFATKSLRYKGYSVMVKERDGLRPGPVWRETCIFCHNTAPHVDTVLGALAGGGAKPYQGVVVEPLLPPDRRAEYVVTDRDALAAALAREAARLGETKRAATPLEAIATTRRRFGKEHLVEVGIGCEACHLGSAEHARDPRRRPSFEPRSAFFGVRYPAPRASKPGLPAVTQDEARRAARLNRACARCHQVLFSGYQPTWEGGTRSGNAGGSHINSGEARDMILGACATKLTCVECHDPHAADATSELRALDAAREDALCTRCHDEYSAPGAQRAHTHHDPAKAGARCLACHMPKKNMSLDGTLSRYHRIGSPTEPARVMLDRPLECALCHGGETVASLVSTMERWWGRSYDRDALVKLYGALDANVLLATAERGKPHEQAVAFQLLGDAKTKAAAPILASQLTHPYPLVRGYAKRALDAIAGAPVPIDVDADDAAIEVEARAWLASRRP